MLSGKKKILFQEALKMTQRYPFKQLPDADLKSNGTKWPNITLRFPKFQERNYFWYFAFYRENSLNGRTSNYSHKKAVWISAPCVLRWRAAWIHFFILCLVVSVQRCRNPRMTGDVSPTIDRKLSRTPGKGSWRIRVLTIISDGHHSILTTEQKKRGINATNKPNSKTEIEWTKKKCKLTLSLPGSGSLHSMEAQNGRDALSLERFDYAITSSAEVRSVHPSLHFCRYYCFFIRYFFELSLKGLYAYFRTSLFFVEV